MQRKGTKLLAALASAAMLMSVPSLGFADSRDVGHKAGDKGKQDATKSTTSSSYGSGKKDKRDRGRGRTKGDKKGN